MDNLEKYLIRLCYNILTSKFNEKKYRERRKYYSIEVQTQPVFSSYGTIGFECTVYSSPQYEVRFDWETGELTIDGINWKDKICLDYLYNTELSNCGGGEFSCYTPADEQMIIYLEQPRKAALQEYIDNFDINQHVAEWWRNGEDEARAAGLPHANIVDHYNDYVEFLEYLQEVCDGMPF